MIDISTLEMDKQAFLACQKRYEDEECAHNHRIEQGERVSRYKLDKLEIEYHHAAIALANAVCGVQS